jgi:ABC-type multidrug transport system fused ATPase/permease subunit
VREADWIVVFEKGTIIESGRHDDLLRRDSVYGGMYRAQWKETPEPEISLKGN